MDESLDDSWDDILDVLVKEEPLLSPQQPPLPKPVGMANDAFSAICNNSPHSTQHISKKRKANPDADDIAKATEEALMQLGLDPNSEEFKLKKRQIRNRISAQSHRDRKNHHITELEIEIAGKNKRIESLEKEVLLLKQENEQLRCLVQRMEISRTSSELSSRTDVESRHSTNVNAYAFPTAELLSASSSTNSDYLPLLSHLEGFPNSSIGSQTPDYSISSAASGASSISLSSQPMTVTTHNHNPSLTSSNPILKSLSFICVICVLCLCSNMAPSGNSSISGVTITNNMLSQDETHPMYRRLLTTAEAMNASPALLESALNLLHQASVTTDNTSITAVSENNHNHLHTVADVFNAASNRSADLSNSYSMPRDNLRKRQLQHTTAPPHSHNNNNNNSSHSSNNSSLFDGLLHQPMQTSRWMTPFLLPASSDSSASVSRAASMRVLRRDLLPFPITQGPQEDWFSYQARLQALSTSQVFLTQGVALLDPAFRPSDRLAALLLQQPTQQMTQQSQQTSSVKRSATVNVKRSSHDNMVSDERHLPLLPSIAQSSSVTKMGSEMDLDEDNSRDNDYAVSTPLLPLPASSTPAMHGADKTALDLVLPRMLAAASLTDVQTSNKPQPPTTASSGTSTASETSSANIAAAAAAAQLVAESNIVTLTIPASAIKLGHSLQESEQGTMDSLLRLFNLTSASTNSAAATAANNNHNQTAVTLQSAWVEMNCIVVGAKVMWQALPSTTTDAASASTEHATASAIH